MACQSSSSGCYRPKPINRDRPLDGSMHFTIMKHPKEALEVMNVLRQSGKLCDVILRADAESFTAHKVVLAAASPYFKAMFCTSGMRESEMMDIPLQGVKPCILATLIDFAYTSEIQVSEMNVCSLLPAATMFQMAHVVEACSTFLEHQLDASNCIGIADFAQAHGCHDLYNKAREFIYRHFGEVSHSEEFMQLSPTQLIQVIKRDELNVRCESEVYTGVINWVSFNKECRCTKMENLIGAVRCHFLTPCFLKEQLGQCELLRRVPKCRDYLSRILQDLTLHRKCPERRRTPISPTVIFTIGGYLSHSLSNAECYNPATKEWFKISNLPVPRSGVAASCVHGLLYVIGGRNNSPDGNVDSASVDCYDPFVNMWRKCSDMSVPRHRVGVGVVDGLMYAIGGSHSGTHHSSVERYDPDTDNWSSVCGMACPRIGVGVAVVNRLLYAVGGYDGSNRLQTMESYNPDTDEWSLLTPMYTSRSGAGVAALDQFIYAVGGYDGHNQLPTVERYDIESNLWELVTSMRHSRSALSVAVVNNKMYALGGYDGQDFLSSVECYDPDRDEWEEETSMVCGRSGHGVTVGMEPCLK